MGRRGRPRKESIEQVLNAGTPGLDASRYPTDLPLPARGPVGPALLIKAANVVVTPDRIAHVLELLKPAISQGIEIIPDDHSVTLRKRLQSGGYVMECHNFTTSDKEFRRTMNRIVVNAASAGG